MPPRSTKNMPPGLRRYWRQKNAAKRARSGASRSRPRRSPRRGRSSKVNRNMPKKSKKSGRKTKASWMDAAAHANTAIQMAEPFLPAVQQAMAGDMPGAVAAARPALAEAASPRNIGQVAIPYVARGFAKKLLRTLRVPNPKLGGRRLW